MNYFNMKNKSMFILFRPKERYFIICEKCISFNHKPWGLPPSPCLNVLVYVNLCLSNGGLRFIVA